MAAEVEGVLVSFSFVLVLEAVVTILTRVLLFHFVGSGMMLDRAFL